MAAAIIIVLLLAAVVWGRMRPRKTLFVPDVDNDNRILVAGLNRAELDEVLGDFLRARDHDDAIVLDIKIAGTGPFTLTFPQDVEPDLFMNLVNYLTYPEAIDLTTHSLGVLGQITLNTQIQLPTAELAGKKALVYVPEDDDDFATVFVHVEGVTYENSFARLQWVPVDTERMPSAVRALQSRLMDPA
jgi:hypothetical protein